MASKAKRIEAANAMIADHDVRNSLFSAAALEDHAWKLLLVIYVESTQKLPVHEDLILRTVSVSRVEGQRLLYWLGRSGYLEHRIAGDDLVLSPSIISTIDSYIDRSLECGIYHAN